MNFSSSGVEGVDTRTSVMIPEGVVVVVADGVVVTEGDVTVVVTVVAEVAVGVVVTGGGGYDILRGVTGTGVEYCYDLTYTQKLF